MGVAIRRFYFWKCLKNQDFSEQFSFGAKSSPAAAASAWLKKLLQKEKFVFLGSVVVSHVYVFSSMILSDFRQTFAGVPCGAAERAMTFNGKADKICRKGVRRHLWRHCLSQAAYSEAFFRNVTMLAEKRKGFYALYPSEGDLIGSKWNEFISRLFSRVHLL